MLPIERKDRIFREATPNKINKFFDAKESS